MIPTINPREYLVLFQSGLHDTSGVSESFWCYQKDEKTSPQKASRRVEFLALGEKVLSWVWSLLCMIGSPTSAFWPSASVGCTPAGDRGGLSLNPLLLLGEAAESLYLIICPVGKKFLNHAAILFLPFWGRLSLALFIYFKKLFLEEHILLQSCDTSIFPFTDTPRAFLPFLPVLLDHSLLSKSQGFFY